MGSRYDAIIVGAGQAGPALARRLTEAGMSVVLVERKLVGGTCVNTGCMPIKALVASARAIHQAGRGGDYGFTTGPVLADMSAIAARAMAIASHARESGEERLRTMRGLRFIRGHARFVAPDRLVVNGEEIEAPRIFLNVGGRAAVPEMPGAWDVPHLDNTDMVALDRLPSHLVVVGGSYVGVEFAQVHRRFGAEVTIVERAERLVPHEDPEVSDALRQILENEGVRIRTSAECIALAPHPDGVAVSVDCRDGDPVAIGSYVLLATGRRPNTDDLGLDAAGIDVDGKGYIVVDDRLETSAAGVWALGDCNGRGAFTHTAYNDFEIVAANLLDGANRSVADRLPGYALYSDPPLGRVGITETEARRGGRPILVATRPMSTVGRAVEKSETQGLMKLVADAETRLILGASILGTGGDEVVHGVLDMMHAGVTIDAFRWAVPIHPTVSELIPTLIGDLRRG